MNGLKISGEVENELEFSIEELEAFRVEEKVEDVRKLGSNREGAGVYLQAILSRVKPKPTVRYITFHSPSDDFLASVPIDRVAEAGVVTYAVGGKAMSREQGGPFRFIIPDPAPCQSDEVDECANVKFLEEIILSAEKGRDTRPADDDEHAKIHSAE